MAEYAVADSKCTDAALDSYNTENNISGGYKTEGQCTTDRNDKNSENEALNSYGTDSALDSYSTDVSLHSYGTENNISGGYKTEGQCTTEINDKNSENAALNSYSTDSPLDSYGTENITGGYNTNTKNNISGGYGTCTEKLSNEQFSNKMTEYGTSSEITDSYSTKGALDSYGTENNNKSGGYSTNTNSSTQNDNNNDTLGSYGTENNISGGYKENNQTNNSSKDKKLETTEKHKYTFNDESTESSDDDFVKNDTPNTPNGYELVDSETEESEIENKLESKKNKLVSSRDWNNEYQSILNERESKEKYDKLGELMKSFVLASEQYGTLIISERNLPNDKKIIQPVSIGGIAGGDKFIVQGILFKFSCDPKLRNGKYLYGGNNESQELAMKAAKHELNNLIAFNEAKEITKENLNKQNNFIDLCTPLMTLIDYKGYRLIATSVLPLKKLIYGTDDGGKTIHNDNMYVNNTFSYVLQNGLHLKEHIVGNKKLCGPADLEGHLGYDNRYYVLDYARLLPPESPDRYSPHSIYYYMLRKELLRSSTKCNFSLNSDAFSNFSSRDPQFRSDNQIIRDLSNKIYNNYIPEISLLLFDIDNKQLNIINSLSYGNWFCNFIHSHGINIRHIGDVRFSLQKQLNQIKDKAKIENGKFWDEIILLEILSRSISQLIRITMRIVKEKQVHSEANISIEICNLLNEILNSNEQKLNLIFEIIQSKYKNSLNENEIKIFQKGIFWYFIPLDKLFHRISEVSSIIFNDRICDLLKSGTKELFDQKFNDLPIFLLDKPPMICKIHPNDIIDYKPKIWKSDLMERCIGIQYLYEMIEKLKIYRQKIRILRLPIISNPEFQQILPFIDMAFNSFKIGLIASPTSPILHYLICLTCLQSCWIHLEHSLYSSSNLIHYKTSSNTVDRITLANKMAIEGKKYSSYSMNLLHDEKNRLFYRLGFLNSLFVLITDGLNCSNKSTFRSWEKGDYDDEILSDIIFYGSHCFPYKLSNDFPVEILFPCLLQQAEIALHCSEVFKSYSLIYLSFMMFQACLVILTNLDENLNNENSSSTSTHWTTYNRILYGIGMCLLLCFSTTKDFRVWERFSRISKYEKFTNDDENLDMEVLVCKKIAFYMKQINDKNILNKLQNIICRSFNNVNDSYLFAVRSDLIIFSGLQFENSEYGKLVIKNLKEMNCFNDNFQKSIPTDLIIPKIIEISTFHTIKIRSQRTQLTADNLKHFLKIKTIKHIQGNCVLRSKEDMEDCALYIAERLLYLETATLKISNDVWKLILNHVKLNDKWLHLKKISFEEKIDMNVLENIFKISPNLEIVLFNSSHDFCGNKFFSNVLSCRKLKKLYLSGRFHTNEFSDDILFSDDNFWDSFPCLENLILFNTDLTMKEYQLLFTCKKSPVKHLYISSPGRSIDDSVLSDSVLKLESVRFTQTNSVTESGWIAFFKNTPTLKSIDVYSHFRGITDSVVESILINCSSIEELNISGCSSVKGTSWLENSQICCEKLEILDISGLNLAPGALGALDKFYNLKSLDISRGPFSNSELLTLVSKLTFLKSLHLRNDCNTGLVEQILKCSKIKELKINQPALPTKLAGLLVDLKIESFSKTLPNSALFLLCSELPGLKLLK